MGWGGKEERFSIDTLAAGDTEIIQISLVGVINGTHSLIVSIESEDGNVSTATKVISVQEDDIQMAVTFSHKSISQDFSGDIDLLVKSDSFFSESVKIRAISSGPGIDYEIYDGVTRVLGQDIIIPIEGKKLVLRMKRSGVEGWIRVSVIPFQSSGTGIGVETLVISDDSSDL